MVNYCLIDRALDNASDEIVALKKMRMENEKEGTVGFSEDFLFCNVNDEVVNVGLCMIFKELDEVDTSVCS